VVANTLTVVSGIHLYLHHRLTASHATAWLAAGMIFAGGVWLTTSGLDHATTGAGLEPTVLLGTDLLVLATLVSMVWLSERWSMRIDPAALGLLLACATSAAVIAVAPAAAPELPTWVLTVPTVVLGVLLAVEVHALPVLSAWARTRLTVATVALVVARASMDTAGPADDVSNLLSVAAGTVTAVLFLDTSLTILRQAIREDREVISALQDQLANTAAQARADRERLHEVKGTIAGIASASKLIHHHPPIPDPSRELLEEMLERETARLQRLVHGGMPGPLCAFDLDDLLRPLVVARRAQGQRVTWQPAGRRVWARKDDLTIVLNVLLDNTAHHAPGEPVAVFSQDADDHVRIVVADSGPGIPEEDRARLFERGARRSGSSGDGLGLHVARRLMLRCGGYLSLDTEWLPGAAFVVGVRAAPDGPEGRCDDAARFVAQ
jgi:signal transduction histidine kinase